MVAAAMMRVTYGDATSGNAGRLRMAKQIIASGCCPIKVFRFGKKACRK
jgi:hypothetical protein